MNIDPTAAKGLGRFKPYPAYKDSGVEWLGEIPSHWAVRRLKHMAAVRLSNVDKKSAEHEESVRLCNYVDVYYNDRITHDQDFMLATATREQVQRFALRSGDVLVTKDSESWTDIAVPAVVTSDLLDVLCGYHLALVRPAPGCYGPFLARAFSAVGTRDQFQVAANGITRFGLGGDAIATGLFATPPTTEQRAIAAFLDRQMARIDALVAKKERLIELLQEKRASLITRAVSKGLDASVPLKDSGVESLGKVPAHWKTMRLRFLLAGRPRNGVSPTVGPSGDTPTFSIAAVKDGVVRIDEHLKYTTIDVRDAKPFLAAMGDILLLRGSGSRSLVGRAGIIVGSPPEGCIYPDILIRVRPNPSVTPWFLVNSLNSRATRAQIEASAKTATGIWKIASDDVNDIGIPVPPVGEQMEIEARVSREVSRYEAATAAVLAALASMNELRTALISAAVTGKIDVRGEVA